MTMKHLMIDLETLSTKSDAPILAIGAVFFDPETGETFNEFYEKVEFESACEKRTISASTVKWWLTQTERARNELISGNKVMIDVIEEFIAFVRFNGGCKPWDNGATFDISILESCLEDYGYEVPWSFWNIRDVRTIVDCSEGIIDRSSIPFTGVPHRALDDAKHQVKYVSAMWQALRCN